MEKPRPTLQVSSVVAGYGRFDVLDDLSLRVAPGEGLAVLGPNGAGKTTLLRAVMGLLRPRSGEILVDGVDLAGRPAYRIARGHVAIVPEGRRLFVDQPVESNLRLGAFHLRRDRPRVEQLLESVYEVFPKLLAYRSREAGALSGGEQQMVAIGRALMADAPVLLLDEPSLGLAPIAVAEMGDALARLTARGLSLLIVEQRIDLVLRASDRLCVLSQGSIAMERATADLDTDATEELISAYLD
jgi:branched-chain amino acid transport system ATP-binding protein